MQRYDFFFGQKVSEGELDAGFQAVDDAHSQLLLDSGMVGITLGGEVSQHAGTANLTVDVSGPASLYDQLGQRISWSPTLNMNCAVDENSNPTAVVSPGNRRWLTIFAKYNRVLSDPRLDAAGATVYFNRADGYVLHVAAGAEGSSPSKPVLRADELVLADIELDYAQTQILNADISEVRRQWAIKTSSGTVVAVGTVEEAVQVLADADVAHLFDPTDAHAASAIGYAGGPTWNDATANPATTVEAQLDKIVSELADEGTVGYGGADKVGSETFTVATRAIASGSVREQLAAVLQVSTDHIDDTTDAHAATAVGSNTFTVAGRVIPTGTVRDQLASVLQVSTDHIDDTTDAHAASAVGYAGGATWNDGTTNPAATVEAQLDKIVSELADEGTVGYGGADKIGSETFTVAGRAIASGSAREQIAAVLQVSTDHIDDTTGAHNASAIGGSIITQGQFSLPALPVQSNLSNLLSNDDAIHALMNNLHLKSFSHFGDLSAANYRAVEFAQGTEYGSRVICVANHANLITSPPKAIWAPRGLTGSWAGVFPFDAATNNDDRVLCLVCGNNILVAAGKYGAGGTGGWIETAPAANPNAFATCTPTGFTTAGCSVEALAWAFAAPYYGFIAVGGDGTNIKISRSTNATTWVAATTVPAGDVRLLDVATNAQGTLAVAISATKAYYSTDDFNTWIATSAFSPGNLTAVTYDALLNTFVISGKSAGDPVFWTSTDGSTWTKYDPGIGVGWQSIESNGHGYLVATDFDAHDIIVVALTRTSPYYFTVENIVPDTITNGPHSVSFVRGRLFICIESTEIWGTTLAI
jgi:hypothetical protein